MLISVMCKWAFENPGCVPTEDVIWQWLNEVNALIVPNPEIQIARTPRRLKQRTAMALIGGAYHEAWHTRWSCRRDILFDEVRDMVLPRWAQIPNWGRVHVLLQDWGNIGDDVRIERLGCQAFPGSRTKMHDLQDFILRQELESYYEVLRKTPNYTVPPITVVVRLYRDAGLGYNTSTQRQALEWYRETNEEAVALVLDGPLTPILRENIADTEDDDIAFIAHAMDCITTIHQIEMPEEPQTGEGSDIPKCPTCGAPPKDLIVRPKPDGFGGQVDGKGIITCTQCGWQAEVDLKDPEDDEDGDEPQEGPRFLNFDQSEDSPEDEAETGGPGEGDGSADQENGSPPEPQPANETENEVENETSPQPQGSEEGGEDPEEGSGPQQPPPGRDLGDPDDKEGGETSEENEPEGDGDLGEDGDNNGNGGGSAEEDGDGESGRDGQEEAAPEREHGNGEDEGDGEEGDGEEAPPEPSPFGGGHEDGGASEIEANDFSDIASNILDDADLGSEIPDRSSALQAAVKDETLALIGELRDNEAPWRPYNTDLDTIHLVQAADMADARAQAVTLSDSVRAEVVYFRGRFQRIIRASQRVATVHGLPRGDGMSERMLVDSKASLRAKQRPQRAYYSKGKKVDLSMALDICLDESWSMSTQLITAARIVVALTEPFEGLPRCVTQVHGVRDGKRAEISVDEYAESREEEHPYHRYDGVRHDIFKQWNERFNNVRWRFTCTQAIGGTPLSDGMQFGLESLSTRKEAHRILVVVTDGAPNFGHMPVINWQLRLAKAAGIHVIGTGIGEHAVYMKGLFPDHVWSDQFEQFPKLMVAKLNELLDLRARVGFRPVRGLRYGTT